MALNIPRLFILPLVLALLAGGCATTSPLMVPVRPSPRQALPLPPASRLRIPVVIPLPKLSDVEKRLSEAVKEDVNKSEKSLVKSMGTTLWWDPLKWDFDGNSLTAHVHLHAKNLPKGTKSGLEEAEKDLKVDLSSALRWSKDLRLEAPDFLEGDTATASVTEEDGKKAERLARRGATRLHESLRDRTKDMANKAKEFWVKIQEPIRMAQDTWLHIEPESLSVGDYRLVPDPKNPRLETVFEFDFQPEVVFGEKPKVEINQMPPLKDYKPGPEGFHIEQNLVISFNEVNKLLVDPKIGILNKALPGSGNHNLKIDHLYIYGSGGQLVVQAEVEYQPILNLSSQPAKLTVYLLGTPLYHEDEQTIDFPDMDFDIKTSDFLVQVAEFVVGSGMKEQLRKEAVIDVGKDMEKLKQQMTKVLNRPLGSHARLKTTITSLKMEDAYITDYGIEGRVAMDGDASVDVDW
ncbi:MAG TPA: DUF4403 family protein [bacterium]|nr:DUF4403 family protein [bacterium]